MKRMILSPQPRPRGASDDAARVQVRTAREPDGARYCPAIFRAHLPRHGYSPHIDAVMFGPN